MSRPKRRPRLPSTVLPLPAPRPPRLLSSAAPIPPPRRPPPKPGELFSAAIKQQLGVVFGRMTRPVTLVLELDDTPLSTELQGFIGEMVALSNGKLNSVAVDAAGVITAEDGSSAPTSLTVGEPLAVTLPDGAELPVYGSLDDSGRAQFDVAGCCRLRGRSCACACRPRIPTPVRCCSPAWPSTVYRPVTSSIRSCSACTTPRVRPASGR